MAISSTQKPGWRSRRRSRLSLVERAVPRLGRMPEPESGPRPSSSDRRSADANTSKEHRATLPAVATLPAERVRAKIDLTPSVGADDVTLLTPPSAENPEFAGRSVTPIAAQPLVTRAADRNSEAVPQAADATDGDEKGPKAVDAELQHLEPRSAADHVDNSAQPPEPHPLRQRIAREEIADNRDDPDITIDWDRLSTWGFIDPRDRTRPLPENMNEIARSLVRQALSDQSSWRDRIILVTSPHEQRPKTVAAISFAFVLTTIDRHSVVLMDANMHGEGAVDSLGGGDRAGLTTALCDDDLDVGEIALKTDLDRLTLLASGAPEEDLLDRFASRRMLQILRFLTRNPDSILVIDAPPILASQESAVLSVIAGQVVLVVEAGRTTADSIERALQRIGDRPNVSLVLNASSGFGDDAPVRRASSLRQNKFFPETAVPLPKRRLPKAVAMVALAGCLGLAVETLGAKSARLAPEQAVLPHGQIVPAPSLSNPAASAFGVAA